MIVIPLKSQYVSLIVTFISGASELALLFAILRWNRLFQNKSLERGRKVNVHQHLNRTKLLTAFATALFLIIEIANSFYSDPTTIERSKTGPCSFLASADFGTNGFVASDDARVKVTNSEFEFHPISISCLEGNETAVRQRGGKMFETDDGLVIQCTETLYSFTRETDLNEAIPDDFVVECVPAPLRNAEEQEQEACSFAYRKGSRVAFSDFVVKSDLPILLEQPELIAVWHTDVAFDVVGKERELASRAAFHTSRGEGDDIDLRRKIFSRDGESMCEFVREIDATVLNVTFMGALASLWVLCLLVFLISLLFQSRLTYDMSDPLDWATKTVIDRDLMGVENPEASSVDVNGRLFVVLSNSTETPDQWLDPSRLLRRRHRRMERSTDEGGV